MYVCAHHKRDSIVQVNNKPHIVTWYMFLFLAHQSTWLQTDHFPISQLDGEIYS
jgi:hypothetical protein